MIKNTIISKYEIRAKKLARNANRLALVANAQHYPEYHNQAPKPHKSIAPLSRQPITSKSYAFTGHKGKEIAKPITHPSESAFEEDNDPQQAQRDKQLQKNLALITKYIKNIYSKPTNNNLRTSSNTRNKNMDTTPRSGNDRNINVDQGDWLDDTDEEPYEQELETHSLYMEKIQEVPYAESGPNFDTAPLEKVESNTTLDSSDVCNNDFEDDQNADDQEDERMQKCLHNQEIELEKYKKYKDCQIKKEELKQIVELHYEKRMDNRWQQPINQEINVLVKNLLIPFAKKTKENAYAFESALKKEMLEDLDFMADIDEYSKMACKYMEKIKECECLKNELSKQKENVSKEVYIELLRSELKKLVEMLKGKYVDTKFGKPSVVRQPNALRIPKPSVLGKPTFPPLPLSSFKELEQDPKSTINQVLTDSTIRVPHPVVQPSPASTFSELPPALASSFVIPEPNPHQPPIPYPSRLKKDKLQDKADTQIHSFLQMFKKLYFNISFAKALAHMPKYAKMVKDLLTNKEKLLELANTPLNENCSAVLFKKFTEKLRDTERFLIPCDFYRLESCMALSDLAGIAEDVFVQVGKFTFLADFVIVDYDVDPRVPLILGRPLLRMAHALVDVHGEELTLRVSDEKLVFNVEITSKYPRKHGDESINKIDIPDITCKDHFYKVLNVQKLINSLSGSPTPSSDPIDSSLSPSLTSFGDSDFLLEEIDTFLASDDSTSPDVDDGIFNPEGDIRLIE
ncbi:reverse transcriptase domain-containing protein [Tanacetum coccineum]